MKKKMYKIQYSDGTVEYWECSECELAFEINRLKGLNVKLRAWEFK